MSVMSPFFRIPSDDLDLVVHAVGSRWECLRGQCLLLTGGTGFIGKWLLATFLRANRMLELSARIIVLSRKPNAFLQQFPEFQGGKEIEWLTGDIRHISPDLAGDCAFAIHAATDVVASSSPSDTLDTCILGTRRILDAMMPGTAIRRVLLLSSGAVYGSTPPELDVIPETWLGAPNTLMSTSAYGEGKRVSELICAIAAAAQPNLEIPIARCFSFVGPHLPLDRQFAIGNFIRAALCGEDVQIQGDGTARRSYLYAADLALWLWCLLFEGQSLRAYNVGGTESLSIAELAQRVLSVLDAPGRVHIARQTVAGVAVQKYVPDVHRIQDELALPVALSLDEAIRRTALWHRAQSTF